MNEKGKHVVILGSGFASVFAYRQLEKYCDQVAFRITLISLSDQFLFVPLAHEVATGSLMPNSITQSLRTLPHCARHRFVMGKACSVDLDEQTVRVERAILGKNETLDIPYDYLISAIGSTTNFFNTPGAASHAMTLKTLADAKKIKNHLIDTYTYAETLTNAEDRHKALSVVIVGGGPTGVELAGELADYCSDELGHAFPELAGLASITIIQGAPRLVPQMDHWFHDEAHVILKRKGVEVRYDARVTKIEKDIVYLSDEKIHARTILWTAGVCVCPLELHAKQPLHFEERSGRIKVNAMLQTESYKNAFFLGDQAWVEEKETGQPYPMRAQFAVRQGIVAGENVYRSITGRHLQDFHWKDQGFILSLGKGGALAELYGVRFSGVIAWWIYRFAYVTKLIGIHAKLRTALEWFMDFFAPRDVSRL